VATNTHLSIASWNLALNAALDTPLASGFIEIYTGTQPATPDTALSGNTLLATLGINATAFGAASSGTKTANAVTSGTAGNTGTATWFRCYKSDGTTAVLDGSCGTSGADMDLNTTSIVSGATVAVTAWTVSMPVAQ
jgi:hypothetical protein